MSTNEQGQEREVTMVFRTDSTREEVRPANGQWFTLEELQGFVGGSIELFVISPTRAMYLNEDGAPGGDLDLPINAWASNLTGQRIFGDVVVGPRSMLDEPEAE